MPHLLSRQLACLSSPPRSPSKKIAGPRLHASRNGKPRRARTRNKSGHGGSNIHMRCLASSSGAPSCSSSTPTGTATAPTAFQRSTSLLSATAINRRRAALRVSSTRWRAPWKSPRGAAPRYRCARGWRLGCCAWGNTSGWPQMAARSNDALSGRGVRRRDHPHRAEMGG